jgi:hypothetical protein
VKGRGARELHRDGSLDDSGRGISRRAAYVTGPAIRLIEVRRYRCERLSLAKIDQVVNLLSTNPSILGRFYCARLRSEAPNGSRDEAWGPAARQSSIEDRAGSGLSAPVIVSTIVVGSFKLVQAEVSAPWPDPASRRHRRRLAQGFL